MSNARRAGWSCARDGLAPLAEFPRLGPELTRRWSGMRFLLGPWRWMLLVYEYDASADRVVILTIQDARSSSEPTYAEEVVAQLVRIGGVVETREAVADIDDEPDDNRVREAAAAGDAGLIVSGDHHLLSLSTSRGISVVTPAGFPEEA